jgi:succinoglycan biosynthesis transport protein ExoP
MLQATDRSHSNTAQESSPLELVNWGIGVVRRQFTVIVLVALLVSSLGTIYAFTAPPKYTSEATLVFDPRRVQLFPRSTFSEGQIDSPALEGEIELVKSEPVALSVIKDLGLAEDSEFSGSQGGFDSVLGFASHLFFSNTPKATKPKVESEFDATRAALGMISQNLVVKRVGSSYNLSIQYKAGNPTRAAQIANAIAEAYMTEQLEGKYVSTRRATRWLEGRLDELNQKQKLAEGAVVDFKKNNDMITADGKLVNEQQLVELNSQLATLHRKTSEAKARLDRIDAVIRDDSLDTKTGPTVADTMNNPLVTQLRTRYLQLVNNEANWSRKYGANHLAVINLREQIREIRGSILEELKRLRESYLSNYEIAKQEEQDLEKRLADTVSRSQPINQAQVPLRDLEGAAQNYRTMNENFRQRYMESQQQQSFPISDVRIASRATPPLRKSSPNKALILVIVGAGGLVLGVAVGTLRELMNGSFCTKAQVESALQAPCISIVPSVEGGKAPLLQGARHAILSREMRDGSSPPRTILRDCDIIWKALNEPFSRFAESLRSIKMSIDLNSGVVSSGRIIGFTSTLPREGKSTISGSLALLLAQGGDRVILVDCDLRNPSLSRKLTANVERGVLDVIVGSLSLEDAVWTDPATNLMFLPASNKTRIANSCEILAATATKKLFEDLRSKYDYVIVDLPPLLPVVDTRATSGFVDSYICVTEWGCSKIAAVKHAFENAPNVYENLLGVVLNKANIDQLSTYDPVGGNYYSNKHYAQYGMTD